MLDSTVHSASATMGGSQDDLNKGEIQKRYEILKTLRKPYEDRAEDVAEFTIPSLFPEEEMNDTTGTKQPNQSLGARGVNSLASKIVLALFPPGNSFIRLDPDLDEKVDAHNEQEKKQIVEIKNKLQKVEQKVTKEVEAGGFRSPMFESIKQLLTAGNVLLFLNPNGQVEFWTLRHYVVRRTPDGEVLEIIFRETKHTAEFSDDEIEMYDLNRAKEGDGTNVPLFTRVWLENDSYQVQQEINGQIVQGSDGSYPKDKNPYIPLTYRRYHGEHYGRGYVEDFLGDLVSFDGLNMAINEGSSAMARGLVMVKPNSSTKARDIRESDNWDVIVGDEDDIGVLRIEKLSDFNAADKNIDRLEKRLSFIFMLNTSVQRKGERVTLGEIRYLASELEDTLGGIYSQLARDLQYPIAKVKLAQLQKNRKVPHFKNEDVTIVITTGIEALGRSQDLQKKQLFMENISVLGPETLAKHIDITKFISAIGTDTGVNTDDFMRDPEDIKKEEQQEQLLALLQQSAPQLVGGLVNQQQGGESPNGNNT